ncbi:MAG: prolyl oligopeptidase family serine peptidase [Gammaproteobacteria bacterium]|nr:prolyl oligopeptidase family serine peptidase [Gammaproteobacteria bacterium]
MRTFPILMILLALGACGSKDSDMNPSPPSGAPKRGDLMSSPPQKLASYSTADLLGLLGASTLGQELLTLAYSPKCSLDVYQLQYATVGGQNEATTASGALIVPTGTDPSCQGPLPLVVYAHGTSTDKAFNIAAFKNSNATEGLILAAVFAARGYIVIAPNYAGYDTSTLGYHPYFNADQQSKEMIDVVTAGRTALTVIGAGVSDNHKLFITGYSQGGFVAMAAQRAMQAAGMTVTASAPMSGPYALAAFGDAIFMGEVNSRPTVNFTLLVDSYQHSYGNVYTNPTDVFEAQYATNIGSLLPSTTPVSQLYAQGSLPQNVLFSNVPPAPEFAAMTPATSPAALAPIFAMGFGTPDLVTNNYRLGFLRDEQAEPDGGFPTLSTGVPAAAPANTLRQDLKTNDLRDWVPAAPVLLCAGSMDPTVFYLNTQLMQQYWTAHPPMAAATVLDIDSAVVASDPYASLKNGFAAAKAAVAASAVLGGATDGGAVAVLQAYHVDLVPPFCLSAVKSFFDGF